MISTDPFWKLMNERKISSYMLEEEYDLNPAEISRLKNNHNFTLSSIDRFCQIFQCDVKDIIAYTPTMKSNQ
ncbi:hypothetical protein LAD12857_10020 [Lacrimispora amygdalina]|uniref:XRE family transcriptional regulator n=1 Tax=Lacrimispora amygdalina TaxID=253257 RepID=A0A3E2NEV3_9FIRM|nr:helix-turn-helix transcriptional regulator [Clostridium indicum]RFZ79514.1 XRE family transcriptional regulator [Clostridium indicum]